MKFGKILGVTIASAAMIGTLAGCGNTQTSTGGSGAQTKETVNLTVSSGEGENVWITDREAAFEKANPNLTIHWKNITISESQTGTTIPKDPATAPNVYLFANDQTGALVKANAIGKLAPNAQAQVEQQNSGPMLASVKYNGSYYGIPFTQNTWFMYYNKSKIHTPGDLDAMLKEGKVAFPVGPDASWYMAAFWYGAGATFGGPDGTDETAAPTGFDNADVMKYMVNFVHNANFVPDDKNSCAAWLAKTSKSPVDACFDGSWDAATAKKNLGDNYAVAPAPKFNLNGTATQMKPFVGSKAIAYNPAAGNAATQAAAQKFALFLGSTESQKALFDKLGIPPADKALASDSAVAADPVATAQIKTTEFGVLQPNFAAFNNAFWTPMGKVGSSLLATGNQAVTAANALQQAKQLQASMISGMKN